MMIPVEQAKAQLDALIDRSNAGEEVLITRDGLPVARMVPIVAGGARNGNGTSHAPDVAQATDDLPPQRLGWAKDIITYVSPDFDEPLEDFREYME